MSTCPSLKDSKTLLEGHLIRPFLEASLYCFSLLDVHAKLRQLSLTLHDPMDCSPPGSSVHRILQARILEWAAISFSNACMHAKSPLSCPTLCYPMDSSPPGSSLHRILQARILEWVAISSSIGNFYSRTNIVICMYIVHAHTDIPREQNSIYI